jgi:hypothetical protein
MTMTDCWVALCSHCHVVWPVESWGSPQFLEHIRAPSIMTPGQYTIWCVAYRIAADRALECCTGLRNMEEFETCHTVMRTQLQAMDASRVMCPGEGKLALGLVTLNGSPECDAMVKRAMKWHQAHRETKDTM